MLVMQINVRDVSDDRCVHITVRSKLRMWIIKIHESKIQIQPEQNVEPCTANELVCVLNETRCLFYFETRTWYIVCLTFLVACSRCSHSGGLHGSREEDDLLGGFCVWSRTVFLHSCHLFPQSAGHAVAQSHWEQQELWTSLSLDVLCKHTEALFSMRVPTTLIFMYTHTLLVFL